MSSKVKILFSLFFLIMFLSCKKDISKETRQIIRTSYKRTGEMNSVVKEKQNKAIGRWKMKQVIVSVGTENKIISINKDVTITEREILNDQKEVIAKSIKKHTGFYEFTDLDSLNGFFYIKDTYPDDFMTFSSGLTVKISNDIRDKRASTIKIIFEK